MPLELEQTATVPLSPLLRRRAPKETANALMRELTELDRIHLVLALQRHTSKQQLQHQARRHGMGTLRLLLSCALGL